MNHFIIISSRHETRHFLDCFEKITKELYPIKAESDFTLRATFYESIEALTTFNQVIVDKSDSDIFPAVLAFHSSLKDLPQRVSEILKQENDKQEINYLVYLYEISRQLNSPDQNAEANILIHDFIK